VHADSESAWPQAFSAIDKRVFGFAALPSHGTITVPTWSLDMPEHVEGRQFRGLVTPPNECFNGFTVVSGEPIMRVSRPHTGKRYDEL
jgi:hypothetical protein